MREVTVVEGQWLCRRFKLIPNNSVWDNIHSGWVERCSENCVFASTKCISDLSQELHIIRRYPYPVYETHIVASTFRRAASSSLFVVIPVASSKPKRLWSVKTVRTPIRWEWRSPSWAIEERLACPWRSCIFSRNNMGRKYGKKAKKFGNVAFDAIMRSGT